MGVALNPMTGPSKTWKVETRTQRRSHVETEAETGGRWPLAQGWMPRAPISWKRREGPSPGTSAGSSALGHPDLRRLVSRAMINKSVT